MPRDILHPMVRGTSVNSLALILETISLFLPCKLIFWKIKLPKLVALQIIQSSYISVVWNPSTTILLSLSHYYKTHIEHIFENITYITTRTMLKPKYLRLPRSIYMQSVENVKQSGPWNSLGIEICAEDGDHETVRPVKQSSRYSWLPGGYMVDMYFQ